MHWGRKKIGFRTCSIIVYNWIWTLLRHRVTNIFTRHGPLQAQDTRPSILSLLLTFFRYFVWRSLLYISILSVRIRYSYWLSYIILIYIILSGAIYGPTDRCEIKEGRKKALRIYRVQSESHLYVRSFVSFDYIVFED